MAQGPGNRPVRRHRLAGAYAAIHLCVAMAMLAGCASLLPSLAPDRQIVVLWHTFTGSEAEALEALTDRFNAVNPWEILLITEYQQQVVRKLSEAPEGWPDLVTVWPEDLQTYLSLGVVDALPTQTEELESIWSDLLPMARSLYAFDGVPYALPLGLATYLVYYNREWLGDLGYDAAEANWDDFRRAMCGATDPLRGRIGLGVPARASTLLAFLAAGGSDIVGDGGYYQFSDDGGRTTASLLQTLMSGDCGVVYNDWDLGPAQLSRSSMAAIVEASVHLAQVERAVLGGRNFPLGISPLPGLEGPGTSLWYGPGLMVSAPQGDRETNALRVLSWLFSPESQAFWGEVTDYVPVRLSVLERALAQIQDDTMTLVAPEASLVELTLAAAGSDTWTVWPPATNRMTCRASLLRALLAFQLVDSDTDAYVDTAVTACNTGVGFGVQPTAVPEAEATATVEAAP